MLEKGRWMQRLAKALNLESNTRFFQLDALRFFLALIVVLGHTIGWGETFPRGAYAVDFFFVLSGFVLSHALINRPASKTGFAFARFARLYPLHLVTLVAMLSFVPLDQYTTKTFFLNVAMLQGFGIFPALTWNGPAWSIGVEFFVNVVVLYPVVRYRAILPASVLAAFAYAVIVTTWGFGFAYSDFQLGLRFISAGMLRGIGGILIGYLIYEAYLFMRTRVDARRHMLLATTIEGMGLVAFLFSLWTNSGYWISLPVVLSAMLVLQMSLAPGYISRLLQCAPFPYLGALSYSIYLIHVPLYAALVDCGFLIKTGLSLRWYLYGLGLLVLSAVSHSLVERPVQNILMRFWRRRWLAIAGRGRPSENPDLS
jgi:peptidoglycan/LPS O-acetylase OafA/YrhL